MLGVLVFESAHGGLRHADPARGRRDPGQSDGRGPPERAALPPGADGGRARCPGREAAGAPCHPPPAAPDLRGHRRRWRSPSWCWSAGRSGSPGSTPRSGRAYSPVRALVAGVVERIPVAEGGAVARGSAAGLPARHLAPRRPRGYRRRGGRRRPPGVAGREPGRPVRGTAAPDPGRRAPAGGRAARRGAGAHHPARARRRHRAHARTSSDRVGSSLEEGDLLLTIGRTDSLELDFGVAQRDIGRVRPGQEVRLRVDAMPQRTFTGRVRAVAPVPADSSGGRAAIRSARVVANPDGVAQAEHGRLCPRAHRSRLRGHPAPPRAGALDASPLVEDLVVTRPAIALALLLAACGGDGAAAERDRRGDRSPPTPARRDRDRRERHGGPAALAAIAALRGARRRGAGPLRRRGREHPGRHRHDGVGRTAARAAREHRPGDRAGAGAGAGGQRLSSGSSASAPSRPPAW